MSYIILAINPGSTSTKIAVYEDTQPVLSLAIDHSAAEIAAFATIGDQFEWRKDLVLESLRKRGFDISTLSAVIGRGGLVHPVEGGVYEVNDALHDDLLHARRQHASNLGGLIAQEIAAEVGVKAYIADPVVVDEMIPYARISGLPQLPRESVFHALNQKAIARRYARETGRKYEELNLIVSHMGGGITVSAHRQGRVIDTSNALNGAGPFSPERAGTLPPGPLIDLCFSGEYTREELQKLINGRGGLLGGLYHGELVRVNAGQAQARQQVGVGGALDHHLLDAGVLEVLKVGLVVPAYVLGLLRVGSLVRIGQHDHDGLAARLLADGVKRHGRGRAVLAL